MGYDIAIATYETIIEKVENRRVQKMVKERRIRREMIRMKLPGVFHQIEKEMKVQDAIQYCKNWISHRQWLKSNKINFENFQEEIEF